MLMRREGDEWVATPGGWIRIKRGQGGRKGRQDWHKTELQVKERYGAGY